MKLKTIIKKLGAGPPYEDFTTYTESDTLGHWSQTETRNTGTTVERDEDSYVYKSYGSEHFGDFEHFLDICCTAITAYNSTFVLWAMTNSPASREDLANGSLFIVMGDSDGRYIELHEKGGGSDLFNPFLVGTTYYCRIKRDGTSLTLKGYSTAELRDTGGVPDVFDLSCTCATTLFEYLQCGASKDTAGDAQISGYIENLDLNE